MSYPRGVPAGSMVNTTHPYGCMYCQAASDKAQIRLACDVTATTRVATEIDSRGHMHVAAATRARRPERTPMPEPAKQTDALTRAESQMDRWEADNPHLLREETSQWIELAKAQALSRLATAFEEWLEEDDEGENLPAFVDEINDFGTLDAEKVEAKGEFKIDAGAATDTLDLTPTMPEGQEFPCMVAWRRWHGAVGTRHMTFRVGGVVCEAEVTDNAVTITARGRDTSDSGSHAITNRRLRRLRTGLERGRELAQERGEPEIVSDYVEDLNYIDGLLGEK